MLGSNKKYTRRNRSTNETESFNDDLDSLFQDIQFGKNPVENKFTYFLPKLTEEELELVERQDEKFMKTFRDPDPDVKKAEIEASESDSKFVHVACRRKTFTMENLKRKTSSSF